MTEQARQRELSDAVEAVQTAFAGAERYRRAQGEARSGRAASVDRAHPLEFDESGFPIAQLRPSFAQRVARHLTPI